MNKDFVLPHNTLGMVIEFITNCQYRGPIKDPMVVLESLNGLKEVAATRDEIKIEELALQIFPDNTELQEELIGRFEDNHMHGATITTRHTHE